MSTTARSYHGEAIYDCADGYGEVDRPRFGSASAATEWAMSWQPPKHANDDAPSIKALVTTTVTDDFGVIVSRKTQTLWPPNDPLPAAEHREMVGVLREFLRGGIQATPADEPTPIARQRHDDPHPVEYLDDGDAA